MPIEYANPFSDFSQGLEAALVKQEAARRQKMLDQIALDREARMKAHDLAQLALDKADAASKDEARKSSADARAVSTANILKGDLTPGVMLDNQGDTAAALRAGHLGDLLQEDPNAPKTIGASTIAMPTAAPTAGASNVAPNGGPVTPAAPKPVDALAAAMPTEPAPTVGAQALPSAATEVKFLGDANQQEKANQRAVWQSMVDNPNTPPDVKLWAQGELGGKTVPTELIKKPDTEVMLRADKDRRVIERYDPATQQWNRLIAPLAPNEKPHWLQEPTPPASINMSTFSPQAIDVYKRLLEAGTINPTVNRGNAPLMNGVLSSIAKEGQPAVDDLATARPNQVADSAALTQVTKSLSAVSAYENTAKRNIGIMKDRMAKILDTGLPIANKPLRDVQQMVGNKDIAGFNTAVQAVVPAVARVLTQPQLTGQLTDSARHDLEAVVRGDANVEQMMEAMDVLDQEMTGRKKDLMDQKAELQTSLRSRGQKGAPAVVAPPTGPKPKRYNPATGKAEEVQ